MSTERDPEQLKDDITVTSDDFQDQETLAPARSGKHFVWIGVIFVTLSLTLGLTLGLIDINASPIDELPFSGQGETETDFKLKVNLSPVSASYLSREGEAVAFVDSDTGCLHVIADNDHEPLCLDKFKGDKVRSINLHDEEAVVSYTTADGATVEVFHYKEDAWSPYPAQGRNAVITRGEVGFGKKTYAFGRNMIVSSENTVFLYKVFPDRGWVERSRWTAIGFDVNPEESRLAVFDEGQILVYDITQLDWDTTEPNVYFSNTLKRGEDRRRSPVATVKVTDTDIHVVVVLQENYTKITSMITGHSTVLNFPVKVTGDAIYSIDDGTFIDIYTGKYLPMEMEEADNVVDVQVSKDCIIVLVERDGVQMVDVYEK